MKLFSVRPAGAAAKQPDFGMTHLRLAVIGVGHLGQAHARVLSAIPGVELAGVVDANFDQAQAVAARHHTRAFPHFDGLLKDVDAACIVVPTCHHESVAAAFLDRGIPVLIEKPLALDVEQASRIVELAQRRRCIVQVGHIERFNPGFEALASLPIRPKFVVCERYGSYTGRSLDVGAVLDLMVHDLDLVAALDGTTVTRVEALGVNVIGKHEDVANARLHFASGCIAEFSVCRIAPVPKRRMQLWSAEGVASLDFSTRTLSLIQPSVDLRLHGLRTTGDDAGVRDAIKAEMYGKHLLVQDRVCESPHDQLTSELLHFVDCVRTGRQPRVNGAAGRDAVALACRVLESLRHHSWNGDDAGPRGPRDLPAVSGPLIPSASRTAA